MKRSALLLLIILYALSAVAQKPEDLQKMQDSMMKMAQQFEKMMKQQSQQLNPAMQQPQDKSNTKKLQPSVVNDDDNTPLPVHNSKLLAAIPSKTFTRAEAVAYVSSLQNKLVQQKGNAAEIKTAQAGMKKYPRIMDWPSCFSRRSRKCRLSIYSVQSLKPIRPIHWP